MAEVVTYTLPLLAKESGVEYRTLHSWVARGILAPSFAKRRGSGNQILFSAEDLKVAKVLARLRRNGLEVDAMAPCGHELQNSQVARCPVCGSEEAIPLD